MNMVHRQSAAAGLFAQATIAATGLGLAGLHGAGVMRRGFLVVHAQALVRHGLALSLQAAHPGAAAHQAADLGEALRLAGSHPALDLVVMDIDGLAEAPGPAVSRLARAMPGTPLVVTSADADATAAQSCLTAGAAAFILKTDPGEVLEHTVALILSEEGCVPLPRWLVRQQRAAPQREPAAAAVLDRLTARQREIFGLLQKGASNKEIARQIGVLEGTVKVHVRTLMQKLGLSNRTQVALLAARCGLRPAG